MPGVGCGVSGVRGSPCGVGWGVSFSRWNAGNTVPGRPGVRVPTQSIGRLGHLGASTGSFAKRGAQKAPPLKCLGHSRSPAVCTHTHSPRGVEMAIVWGRSPTTGQNRRLWDRPGVQLRPFDAHRVGGVAGAKRVGPGLRGVSISQPERGQGNNDGSHARARPLTRKGKTPASTAPPGELDRGGRPPPGQSFLSMLRKTGGVECRRQSCRKRNLWKC